MNRKIKITTEAVAKYRNAPIDDAVLQAIYNSIDADAAVVEITALTRNDETLKLDDDSETLTGIKIEDNGTGIPYNKLEEYFQQLERSWKNDSSPNGRAAYHGSKGCGRFKGFAIGEELEWRTVYRDKDGKYKTYTMKLDVNAATQLVVVDEPREIDASRSGTILKITSLTKKFIKQFASLAELKFDVLTGLLVDIEVYHKVIKFFGEALDPAPLKADEQSFSFAFQDNEGTIFSGETRILAWKPDVQFVGHKHAFYYKPNGAFVAKRPSHAFADTHYPPHTLIVHSEVFDKYSELEADFNVFDKMERAMRPHIIAFLTRVKSDEFSGMLGQIFDSDDYPYKKATPMNAVEEAKMTAYNAFLGAMVFENSGVVAARKKQLLKVVFPLINRLFSGDNLLGENIDSVLSLDADGAQKYHRMVTRLKLSKIVDRYNRVQRRYTFLDTLNRLVHIKEYSDDLRERTQLHKIVAEEVWIFGPEFEQPNLITSDKSINTLLRQCIARDDLLLDGDLDREKMMQVENFILANRGDLNKCLQKIPDLVLAKPIKGEGGTTRYLIIELKRPSVLIDEVCREQARNVFAGIYNATNGGGLKIDANHKWEYWLVSTGVADSLKPEFGENDHLESKMGGNYVIDVRCWDAIIENARKRLDEEMAGIEVDVNDADCKELLAEYRKKFGVRSSSEVTAEYMDGEFRQ